MLRLTLTTDKIQIVLAGAVTANQLQCFATWKDFTTTTCTEGRNMPLTNNTTDVDLVPAPDADHSLEVDYMSIYNADTENATVTIKFDADGTERILHKDVIEPGKTLQYVHGAGFSQSGQSAKQLKSFTFHGDAGVNFAMTNATLAERFAGNSTRHLFMVDLEGYTQVRLRTNIQVLSASAGTPRFRVKYCVGWSTTVANFLQIGSEGQCEVSLAATGYIDTGWMSLAAGARVNGITIGCTELGGDAAADPALGATDILFQ